MSARSRAARADRRPRPAATAVSTPARASRAGIGLLHPALWCALAAAAIYLASLKFGFVHDDHWLIERNPLVRGRSLGLLFTTDFWAVTGERSGLWRPLVILSFWIQERLWPGNAAAFHAFNVIAHALATALVALLIAQSIRARACVWIGALWFAVMPVHHESVAWIAGRTDVMCAVFLFLALWLDRRARAAGRAWPGVMAPAALALALLSKETAAVGVGLVAVAEWVERPEPSRDLKRLATWLAPYLAVTAVYVLLHRRFTIAAHVPAYLSEQTRHGFRWVAWQMLPEYLATLGVGYPHSPDKMLPPATPWGTMSVLGIVLQLAFAVLVLGLVRRRSSWALPVALFWFPILPAFVLTLSLAYPTFAERLLYISSGGAAWALATALAAVGSRARLPQAPAVWRGLAGSALALGGLWVAVGAAETLRVLPVWRDDGAMFRAMSERQPANPKGRVGWGLWLAQNGQPDAARREIAAAESLDARYPDLYTARGQIEARLGRWDPALQAARQALALDSLRRDARLLEASALMRLGPMSAAEARIRRLMDEEPGEPEAESLWGQILMTRGRDAEALPYLTRAAAWRPDDAGLLFALGTVQLRLQRPAEAITTLEKTVAVAPNFYEGWLRLAMAQLLVRDSSACERALRHAESLPEATDGRVLQVRALLAAPPRAGSTP